MKQYADIAAALRNTPAEALREAGYLDRAADVLARFATPPASGVTVPEGERAGRALVDAWCRMQSLPPIEFAPDELDALVAAVAAALSTPSATPGEDRPLEEHQCWRPRLGRLSHRQWMKDGRWMLTCERCGTPIDREHKETGPVSWTPTERPTATPGALDLATVAPLCAPGEVDRLRTALQEIAADRFGVPHDRLWEVSIERRDMARAALSPQGLDAKEGGE